MKFSSSTTVEQPERIRPTSMKEEASHHQALENNSINNATAPVVISSSIFAIIEKMNKTTFWLRISFLLSLVATALVCGFVTQRVIFDLEKDVGLNTYESVATSAVELAQEIAMRKVDAAMAVASIVRYAFPNAVDWPFVALPGFSQTAQLVSQLSATNAIMGLIMLVQPKLVSEFEDFAYQTYRQQGYYLDTAGRSDFGFGIFKREFYRTNLADDDETSEQSSATAYPDGRLHDSNGTTYFDSKYNLLFPIFQFTNIGSSNLLFNVHSERFRGLAIDSMLDCSAQKAAKAAAVLSQEADYPDNDGDVCCTVITDFVELMGRPGPAALIYTPVYPANDSTTMVGMIGTSIHWQEILHNVVPDYINGLDCVISTHTNSYTFRLEEGQPQLIGEGDLHDERYTHLGHSVSLTEVETAASASAKYTLTIYPRKHLLTGFVSNSRFIFSVGFVAVIFFCGCLFFLYDFFMKHESHQRKKVLEIKRRFVRFISHEIRTPLNTVALGLELLHSEVGEFLRTLRKKNGKTTAYASDSSANKSALGESSHSMIGKRIEDVEAWVDLLCDIQQNTDVSISILNDLLNYDKIEDGNLKLEIDVVSIWHVVSKTIKEFDIQARKREIHLESTIAMMQEWKDTTTTSTIMDEEEKQQKDTMDNKRAAALDPECPDHLFQTKVIGDETRLCQVLRNLISNSLKFTPAGGQIQVKALYKPDGLPQAVTPKLPRRSINNKDVGTESSCCTDDHLRDKPPPRAGSIRISVKDNGTGMTKEQLSQLFSEGVQFDANKLQAGGGSGLGLYITKGLVEQHGGIIVVTSEGKGCGSEFTVELPLYQFEESSASITFETVTSQMASSEDDHHEDIVTIASMEDSNTSQEPPLLSPLPAPKQRILVVDDALTNRKMLSRLLERNGHECLQAKDGKEAVELYLNEIEQMKTTKHDDNNSNVDKYQPFSTILLDYEMPIMNGPECCQILRAQHGCHALIFGVTGNLLGEDVQYFEEMGANCVLPKPVSIKQLEKAWMDYGSGNCHFHNADKQ